MNRPLWIEALSYLAAIAFWWVMGTYFMLNCIATGNTVRSLLKLVFS